MAPHFDAQAMGILPRRLARILRKMFGDLSNMLPGFMWVSKSWVPIKFQVWQKHTSLSSLIAMNRNKSTQISQSHLVIAQKMLPHTRLQVIGYRKNQLIGLRKGISMDIYVWIHVFPTNLGFGFILRNYARIIANPSHLLDPFSEHHGALPKEWIWKSDEIWIFWRSWAGSSHHSWFWPVEPSPHDVLFQVWSFKSRCFKSPVGSCRSEFASYTQPQMVPMDPVWPANHGKSLVIRLKFGAGWWVFTEFGQVVGDGWLRVYYIDWSSVSHFRVIFPLDVVEDIEKKVDCC